MNATTCVICGSKIEGIWIPYKRYLGRLFTLNEFKIGFQCQNCGTCICTAGKRKDHPYGKISLFKKEKFNCPECGEVFEPSHAILKQDAPFRIELRKLLGETGPTIEANTYHQISEILDKGKWRNDKNVQEQLIEQLKIDGNGYMYQCLEELVWETEKSIGTLIPESQQSVNRLYRVARLAEIGAVWLFEDGMAEDILVYIIEHMQDHIRPGYEDNNEHPTSIFAILMWALLQVETVTRSGKSIPALVNTLHNDDVICYRRYAAYYLGQINWDTRVVEALIQALNDKGRPHTPAGGSWFIFPPKRPSVQERVVITLIQIGDERGLAATIPILGKKGQFAFNTDIEHSGEDTAKLLSKIGLKFPHLLTDALKIRDENVLRKEKNFDELTIIRQVERALDQIGK